MPRKRSKSEEREKKKKYRQNRKPDQILLDQEKDRNRKNERKLNQTEEDRQLKKDAAKLAMKKYKQKISQDRTENETKINKYNERMENQARIRNKRDNQTDEDHERGLHKAKEGMVTLRARKTEEEPENERERAK